MILSSHKTLRLEWQRSVFRHQSSSSSLDSIPTQFQRKQKNNDEDFNERSTSLPGRIPLRILFYSFFYCTLVERLMCESWSTRYLCIRVSFPIWLAILVSPLADIWNQAKRREGVACANERDDAVLMTLTLVHSYVWMAT